MAKRLVVVFVIDGLRPDAITPEDTPTLYRLRAEGVNFTNSHAVFPTVTRVNAATLATGAQPGTHGIVGNELYVPAVDARRAVSTGEYHHLLTLDHARTLADRLHAQGLRFVGVSSGSTGSAYLLNPRAPDGVGALVNGYFDPGKTVAFPSPVNEAILARFGAAPDKKTADPFDAVVGWAQRVLREYVLPELRPDVVIDWLTEPDHSQHLRGVGSPAARHAIRHADRQVAEVLAVVDPASTNAFVVSDHGFTTNTTAVDVTRALVEAGVKASANSPDVVLASSGQAVAVHVASGDVAAVARFVQSQDWGGVLFTAERAAGDPRGVVDGTFALELIHLAGERRPDLLFTFPWTSDPSAFGVRGTDLAMRTPSGGRYHSDHGSMSPWNVRNTFFAWGADFKRSATVRAPAGNVDVAPTIRALLELPDADGFDGRVLHEALAGGPDEEALAVETRVRTVEAGAYRAAIQISTLDGRRYVDKSWRVSSS
jgi:arylsulfatase A-like enzyme